MLRRELESMGEKKRAILGRQEEWERYGERTKIAYYCPEEWHEKINLCV